MIERTRERNVVVFAVVAVAVIAALLATDVMSARSKEVMSDTAFIVASSLALAAAAGAAVRSEGRLRRAWVFLALSAAAWTMGNLLWFHAYVISDGPTSYPTWYDPFYLLAPILAVVGLVAFPGRLRWGGRFRVVLDGGLVAVSLLYVSWELILDEAVKVSGFGPLARATLIGYPLLDVVAGTFAILLATRARPHGRSQVTLVAAGLACWAVADSVFASQSLRHVFRIGTLLDLGWIVGPLLIGVGALLCTTGGRAQLASEDERVQADSQSISAGTWVTFVPPLVAIVVRYVTEARDRDPHSLDVVLLGFVLAIFFARQLVTLRENIALTRTLEERVRDRTADLAWASEQHQLTLMAVADGILRVDADGRVQLANDAAQRMLRTSEADLIEASAHDVLHRGVHEAPDEWCPLAESVRSHETMPGSSGQFARRDGTTFLAEYAITSVADEGRQDGAVVVFRDITERREIDRMKDEFISVVSHELRTPLTSIRGSLGLLAGGLVGELSERGQRMVDIAVDNTDRLIRLINDILDIERIQSGSAALQKAEHEVASVIAEAMRVMLPVAREADVEIGLGKVEGRIWADQDRMVQTLTNLLSNAVKFSPTGGVVTLTARRDGSNVLFAVADAGRGVPADKLDAVFGRFQQVDASDSRDKGGTGLGLAICKSIVEQHGGEIWVDSTEGAGATFSFTIPAVPEPRRRLPTHGFEPDGDGPAILICDDDPSLLEIASTLLVSHGYRAILARSGEEATTIAERVQPAAIVLDMFMPGMDGWKTVKALKANPATQAIPIVVLTVLGADEGAGVAEMVDGWITKPVVNTNRLLGAIEQVVRGAGHRPRVLVVEDDPDLAHVLVSSLERHGVRAVSADSAAAAIRLSRTLLPDLIILDLVLPDGDGFTVVEQLRRDGRLASLPLVVYTARDLSNEEKRRLTLGETAVFFKSEVSPEVFETKVIDLLDRVTGAGAGNVLA